MREGLDEPVSIVWYYNAAARHMKPHSLTWNGRDYRLGSIDFWHRTTKGKTLVHHFSVADADGQVYFKLAFDTRTLHWTLEEYMTAQDMAVRYRRK